MDKKTIGLAILVPLIWGIQADMLKLGLHQFPPIFMVGMRFAIMSVFLVPFLGGIRGSVLPALAVSLTQGVAHFALLYIGFQYTDVSAGIVAYQTNAIFTIILGALLLNEKITKISAAGILLAFFGVALIVGEPKHSANVMGLLIIIGSAVMFSVGNIIARKYGPMRTTGLNAMVSIVSAPALLLISYLTESGQVASLGTANWQGWGALLYTAFIGGIAAFTIWYWLLTNYSVGKIAPYGLLMPLFAMIGGVFILGESLTAINIAGAALTISGVALAQFGKNILPEKYR
ncbi:EamA family transporter [Polynucleobacter sp. JS-Safj-400b-B2]|uniref:DMT family transporter n=1 Tax=Polynucleobacter sp. JS-Safj-400b-B2 TaxID=2576921 RepID=UPI001C0CF5A6|nr:EamA family transporter [Polynucleobacter sp. JS-Safj-400b-B2]